MSLFTGSLSALQRASVLSPEVSKLCGDLGRPVSVLHSSVGLVDASSIGFQPDFFWGDCLAGAGLKSWVPNVG